MMNPILPILDAELLKIRAAGLYKEERVIQGPQGPRVLVDNREVLNFCSNNYPDREQGEYWSAIYWGSKIFAKWEKACGVC